MRTFVALALLIGGCAPETSRSTNLVDIPAPPSGDAASPSRQPSSRPTSGSVETKSQREQAAPVLSSAPVVISPAAPSAPATPAPVAASAEQLFQEGRQALSNGDFVTARARFEQSFKLDPAIGTLLNLALSLEKLQLTPEACRAYRDAEALALQRGQNERAKLANDRASALKCP